jgi:hypothetical protein
MQVEREQVMEALAAVVPVLALIVAVVIVGVTFTTDGGLSPTGGQALVGVIVAFVVVMTGVGVYLSRGED